MEALGDSTFRNTIAERLTQYFETNADTTSSRAIEWDAHKAAIRGQCISTIWGVKIGERRVGKECRL